MNVEKERVELSVDSRLKQIFAYEESRRVFDQYLPGMRERVESQTAVMGFSVRKLISYSRPEPQGGNGGAVSDSLLEELDRALRELVIYTETAQSAYTDAQPLTPEAAQCVHEDRHTAVFPGRVWRDTNGFRIQTHGGALFYEDGLYYWYGENKDRTDGTCSVWTWGIRAYASTDLYNWEDKGLIIKPDLQNRESGLYPEKHVDRPHIVKCDKTGKYVCWIKQSGEEACFLILQADAFLGPYTVIKENYRPFGIRVGDFDIIKDTSTRGCYLFMDAEHAGVMGMELSDDYLAVEQRVCMQYENLYAPFCREGITLFERADKKYMLTSGMSGYIPNKSDLAVSDHWTEPFTSLGSPHVEDDTNASFNSQISQVFRVPGKKDLYIAVADRWVPDYYVDARRADLIERSIAAHYDPENYHVSPEEQKEIMESPMLESANTSASDYVWLPLRFDGDRVWIEWKDEWKLEDYEDA